MKFTYLTLIFAFVLFASCSKDALQSDQTANEKLFELQKESVSAVLPNGNGVQKLNGNQITGGLVRGTGVAIPFFSDDPVQVKAGSWVTLGFSVTDFFSSGMCPEDYELTDTEISEILESSQSFLTDIGASISFGGEVVEMGTAFRENFITLFNVEVYDEEGNFLGYECGSSIPWRYFVIPQAIGDYEFTFNAFGSTWTRTVSWVPASEVQ